MQFMNHFVCIMYNNRFDYFMCVSNNNTIIIILDAHTFILGNGNWKIKSLILMVAIFTYR